MFVPRRALRLPGQFVLACCASFLAVAGDGNEGAIPANLGAPLSAVAREPATGELWIGTLGAGLIRSSAGRLDRFTQFNSGLAGDLVLDVKVWGGRVIAATTRGIAGYDPRTERWTVHLERRGDAPPIVIVRLVPLPSGSLGELTLHGCASDGRVFHHDVGGESWIRSENASARAACASALAEAIPPPTPTAPPLRAESSAATAIGILIPMSRSIPIPGAVRGWPDERLDRVVVDELLQRRSARGRAPIPLSPSAFTYERHAFGTPEDTLSILHARPEVAGVLGLDIAPTSAESVVAARLGIPIVDAAPGPPEGEATADPWVFRCSRYGYEGQAAALDALLAGTDRPRLALVRTGGAETARRLDFWAERAVGRGAKLVADIPWDPAAEGVERVVSRIRGARAGGVLTWTDARTSAALLRALRSAGVRAALLTGPETVNEEFAQAAPPDAGAVLAVAPCPHGEDPGGPVDGSLRDRTIAAAAHLLAAVETTGHDRAAVRAELERRRSRGVARLTKGVWVFSF